MTDNVPFGDAVLYVTPRRCNRRQGVSRGFARHSCRAMFYMSFSGERCFLYVILGRATAKTENLMKQAPVPER